MPRSRSVTGAPAGNDRTAARDRRLALALLAARAGDLVDAVALLPLDRSLLLVAGAFAEPALRARDAVHIASAADFSPLDGF